MKLRPISCRSHKGLAIIPVLVVLSVSVTLCGVWTRRMLDQRRWTARRREQVQAAWLADAGLQRAIALRRADPEFRQALWIVNSGDWDWPQSAEVELLVEEVDPGDRAQSALRIVATARYPRVPAVRVQISTEATLASPP